MEQKWWIHVNRKFANLPAATCNMQNTWWRRNTLLYAFAPASRWRRPIRVVKLIWSLNWETVLAWHKRKTWTDNFVAPATSACQKKSKHAKKLKSTPASQPRKDFSSSTYFKNNKRAASRPLWCNSRSIRTLLASIRTFHGLSMLRKGEISSEMRSCNNARWIRHDKHSCYLGMQVIYILGYWVDPKGW